jgi:hypothetical protein
MKKIIYTFIVFFLIAIPLSDAYPQRTKSSGSSGEQRSAEKGLKDNRYFFYFINTTVTNFGSEEEKKIFKEAVQRDFIAQLLYMKFKFHDSFTEIRKSQKLLIDLYRMIIIKETAAGKELLNSFAPETLKTNDFKSRTYLKYGYRDQTESAIFMGMADNFRDKLYSMRLYMYVRSIKIAKHGKRYAFLSALESRRTPVEKKKNLSLKYDDLMKNISEISPEKKEFYSLVHLDNYYKSKDPKSLFDKIWESPDLADIPEYKEYLKMED